MSNDKKVAGASRMGKRQDGGYPADRTALLFVDPRSDFGCGVAKRDGAGLIARFPDRTAAQQIKN
jgi:hypothetical protein